MLTLCLLLMLIGRRRARSKGQEQVGSLDRQPLLQNTCIKHIRTTHHAVCQSVSALQCCADQRVRSKGSAVSAALKPVHFMRLPRRDEDPPLLQPNDQAYHGT
jgi:hypothetical protein